VPFTGQRREGRRCRGRETAGGEWSFSMLPFQGEERMGQCPFWKGKRARWEALGSLMADSWSWVERLFGPHIVVDIK
jgi:hypothetical protein